MALQSDIHDPVLTTLGYNGVKSIFRDPNHEPLIYMVVGKQQGASMDAASDVQAIAVWNGYTRELVNSAVIDYGNPGYPYPSHFPGPVIRPPVSNSLFTIHNVNALGTGPGGYPAGSASTFWFVELNASTLAFVQRSATPADEGFTWTGGGNTYTMFDLVKSMAASEDGAFIAAVSGLRKISTNTTSPWPGLALWSTVSGRVKYCTPTEVNLDITAEVGYGNKAVCCFAPDGNLWILGGVAVASGGTTAKLREYAVSDSGSVAITLLNTYTVTSNDGLSRTPGGMIYRPGSDEFLFTFAKSSGAHLQEYYRFSRASRTVVAGPVQGPDTSFGASSNNSQELNQGQWTDQSKFVAALWDSFYIFDVDTEINEAPVASSAYGDGPGTPFSRLFDCTCYIAVMESVFSGRDAFGGDDGLGIYYDDSIEPPPEECPPFDFPIEEVPCVTRWCQCWSIARRDGEVFRFTSLDRDFTFDGNVYRTCASLTASAASSTSEPSGVSNTELVGILKSTDVDEADLYGGLFEDAYCEVWLVPWEGAEEPRRLAAGWAGQVKFGELGHTMEVLGPGARLEQTALLQVYSPKCRYSFGDSSCTINVEALKITGTVVSAVNRGSIVAALSLGSDGGSTFDGGKLRWTSGPNNGRVCEVKTVDFGTGEIELWALTSFIAVAGNTFDLLPGCAQDAAACKAYGNYINFGGFPDVPGTDAIMETPNAKS